MTGFLYYSEDDRAGGIDAAELELPNLFPRGIACCPVEHGPDGTRGILFRSSDREIPPERMAVAADKQTWRAFTAPHGKRLYVGLWNDARPTPEALRREGVEFGRWVEAAGLFWRIPRLVDHGRLALPFWFAAEHVEYAAHLLRAGRRIADAMKAGGDGRPIGVASEQDLRAAIVDALAVNYRVAADELALLGVMDDSSGLVEVMIAATSN